MAFGRDKIKDDLKKAIYKAIAKAYKQNIPFVKEAVDKAGKEHAVNHIIADLEDPNNVAEVPENHIPVDKDNVLHKDIPSVKEMHDAKEAQAKAKLGVMPLAGQKGAINMSEAPSKGIQKLKKFMDSRQIAKTSWHEKGVHHPVPKDNKDSGESLTGHYARKGDSLAHISDYESGKEVASNLHNEKLAEIKKMPKPSLPKSEEMAKAIKPKIKRDYGKNLYFDIHEHEPRDPDARTPMLGDVIKKHKTISIPANKYKNLSYVSGPASDPHGDILDNLSHKIMGGKGKFVGGDGDRLGLTHWYEDPNTGEERAFTISPHTQSEELMESIHDQVDEMHEKEPASIGDHDLLSEDGATKGVPNKLANSERMSKSNSNKMPLKDFHNMLSHHDWYHSYADDIKTRNAGEKKESHLKQIAEQSPEHKELFENYHKHMFSGPSFGTQRHPKPESLNKAREDKLIHPSQRQKFREEKRKMEGRDILQDQVTSSRGVSDVGIEVRRADKRKPGVISHGYARIAEPEFHATRAKKYLQGMHQRIKDMPKPNLPKSEEMYKATESKHDRCVESVEQSSPEVKNPHAVCVARGVTPRKWKK